MNADFYKALEFVLKWEGKYSQDTLGGKTYYGIASKYHPEIDFESMTDTERKETATDIYYREYWLRYSCQILAYPLCICHFNCCVNPGSKHALKILSHVTGATPLEEAKDYLRLQRDTCNTIVSNNPIQSKYLKGWLNRVNDLEAYIT